MKKISVLMLLQVALLIAAGTISIYLGQDANWDLKNYHIYNAWAFLNDRSLVDLSPAGVQSYFSPYLDLPYYYLSQEWLQDRPRWVAFLIGFPYGIVLFSVFIILNNSFEELGLNGPYKYLHTTIYGLIGVTGVATISQVGTTFNEMYVAAITLASVAMLSTYIKKIKNVGVAWLTLVFFLSGFALGIATGLKLTAAIYSIAAVLGVALLKFGARAKSRIFFAALVGCALGFLMAYLPWGIFLYRNYENPFFPMFNSIFRSEWSDLSSDFDRRFLPKSMMEYLFYPIYWANDSAMRVMEPQFKDWRFAMAFIAMLIILLLSAIKIAFARRNDCLQSEKTKQIQYFIISFVFFSYVAWLFLFSILRYAIPIEALSGLIVAFAVIYCVRILMPKWQLASALIGLFLLVFLINTTKYPDWGRVNFGEKVFSVGDIEIPSNSRIVLLGKPLAFYAPFIARENPDVVFLGYSDKVSSEPSTRLGTEFAKAIYRSNDPVYTLVRYSEIGRISELSRFNLFDAQKCKKLESNIDNDIHLCELQRRPVD